MDKRTPANLWELHRACVHLLERTANKTPEEINADYDLSLIVERLFERIGETLRRIEDSDPDTVQRIANYRKAIHLRNIIAHEYYHVDWVKIRTYMDGPVPRLLESVDESIQEIPEEMKL